MLIVLYILALKCVNKNALQFSKDILVRCIKFSLKILATNINLKVKKSIIKDVFQVE